MKKIPNSTLLIMLLIVLVAIVSIFIFFTPSQSDKLLDVIQNGLTYLNSQINPEIGLLREAPIAAPNKYWLTNDNSLAAYTFEQFGHTNTRKLIVQSINKYGSFENNFIEVVMGNQVSMPPFTADAILVKKIGEVEIWTEKHETGAQFEDWQEYANLSFLMTLNLELQDSHDIARQQILTTMKMFDGVGFRDKAFNGTYETYKMALAIYSAHKANVKLQDGDKILEILLKMQDKNGGFHTHYDENLNPMGDTNTETTSFSLLALRVLVYR